MRFREQLGLGALFLISCALIFSCALLAEQVPVSHKEGLVHGFLVLRTLQGEALADGELLQNVRGDRVTTHLVFRFKDGSVHDDTAVFSQRGSFRLLSDHLIQKGPSFKHPMEMIVNAATGQVTVRYEEDGKEKTASERLRLPADIANGLIFTLIKNIRPQTSETKVGFVVPTPKPQLVTLKISPQGEEPFSTGDTKRSAVRFAVKVEIGGIKGALASLLGKDPPDTQVWILEGEAPAFVKSEGPLALDTPVWRIELVSPAWPRGNITEPKEKK